MQLSCCEELLPLQWYDNLSPDAQRVMLSLQRKYTKMRDQILLSQMKKERMSQDPNEYYRSLYSHQFKAEPTPSRPKTNTNYPIQRLRSNNDLINSQRTGSDFQLSTDEPIHIKTEPPDSPCFTDHIFKRPFEFAQKSEIHVLQPHAAENVPTINQKTCFDQSSSTKNEFPAHTYDLDAMSLLAANDRERTKLEKRKRSDASSHEEFNRTKQLRAYDLSIQDRAGPEKPSNLCMENNLRSSISECPKRSQSVVDAMPETSFNLGFLEQCELTPVPPLPLEADISTMAIDEDLYLASQDLFTSQVEPVQVSSDEITFDQKQEVNVQRMQIQKEQELSIVHVEHDSRRSEDVPCDLVDHSYKNQCLQIESLNPTSYSREEHTETTFIIDGTTNHGMIPGDPISAEQRDKYEMEDRNINRVEVVVADKQRTSVMQTEGQSHIENYFQRQPCSVARKLELNKKMRETERKKIGSTSMTGEKSNTDKTPKIPDFCKAKMSKMACGKQTDQLNQHQTTVGDASVIQVQHLSEQSRNRIREDICSSQSVCLSLVYSDNTTSMRCFQPSGLKVKFVAVKVFAVKSHPGSSVALFSCTADDTSYLNWFKNLILEIMENNSIEKIVMNGKQVCVELLKLLEENWQKDYSSWRLLDPVVGSWLLNSDKPPRCLQDVIKESGVRQTISVIHDGVKSLDADLSLLHDMMTKMRERLWSHGLWGLFCNIETRLIPLLAQLEMQRFKVNTATFVVFSNILKKKLTKLEEKAFASAGHSFCINSHPQLRQVLYEELRLDEKLPGRSRIAKTTVAHQKSTSEATLTQLKDTHTLPAIVLEYRQLQKLKSTYVDGMASCVRKGYLSTHWDQTAAVTGRLTSFQPNIQAIPKVPVTITDVHDNFIVGKVCEQTTQIFAREPFISHEGHLLLAADFQQIELRLLAHLADDQVLLGIFNNPQLHDIFIELTSQWLGKSADEVSPPEREQTKRIVYSVMYGVGKEKLADYLKVSSNNAKAIMTSFLTKFPAVNSFTKKCVDFCQQHGFTHTIFKRKRLIPNINHPSHQLRAQAGRQAVNFCVQGNLSLGLGSAADLCKAAMLQVQSHLNKRGMSSKVRLLAQIHDELLYEVEEEHLDTVKGIVKAVMEDSGGLCGDMTKLNVPIRVSLSTGTSWAHLQSSE